MSKRGYDIRTPSYRLGQISVLHLQSGSGSFPTAVCFWRHIWGFGQKPCFCLPQFTTQALFVQRFEVSLSAGIHKNWLDATQPLDSASIQPKKSIMKVQTKSFEQTEYWHHLFSINIRLKQTYFINRTRWVNTFQENRLVFHKCKYYSAHFHLAWE